MTTEVNAAVAAIVVALVALVVAVAQLTAQLFATAEGYVVYSEGPLSPRLDLILCFTIVIADVKTRSSGLGLL